jgi:hypothetical protein
MIDMLADLDSEVEQAARNSTVEMILLLIDKWEHDIEVAVAMGKASVPQLLHHYVRLKISLHHVSKAWERGWSTMTENQFVERVKGLSDKVKQSRRDYYVAKREYETQCSAECACRGCRCIEGIASNRS